MGSKKKNEIRESRKSKVLGTLAGWIMKIWCSTLRYEVEDLSGHDGSEPRIFLMWHSRIFIIPYIWSRTKGCQRNCVVLTSASHDGSMLAHAMKVFGLGAVRGSSSRRLDVCITPDGPRGPRYVVQPGVIKVAEFSGARILPIHARCTSAWRLKTWDRLVIPMPFSKVRITYGETLAVPRGLDETAFEATRLRIEEILCSGTDDL
jgi:lysophospholipid acyltransferase (LPLAT)-like uncharacterized protein